MGDCAKAALKDRLRCGSAAESEWFRRQFAEAKPGTIPIYASFDLRDAHYKIAPVDANLFPAGFNNICPDDLEHAPALAVNALKQVLGKEPDSILILPENHTRNHFYAENLYELRQVFRGAGIRAELGWWENDEQARESAVGADGLVHLSTPEGTEMTATPVRREGNRLIAGDFNADVVFLNNDYSSGAPAILEGLSQPVIPSPRLGWHTRRKDRFFTHYNALVADYAKATGIDPWTFTVATERVAGVDFQDGRGIDTLIDVAGHMLAHLREEYARRKIDAKPFVFIKNNAGTYGMGVMRINDAQELKTLNRRDRNKMTVGKGNRVIDEVIVQEGIPTRHQVDGAFAEPVVYMMGTELIGGFLRKNPTRGDDDNLNSRGMVFQKLCMADLRRETDRDLELELCYGTISRIACAALTHELRESL